jgi:preprotein translocase SecE subunit
MSNFITEANTELEHVVWPTPAENKKYMIYTVGVIIVIGIFLAVLGYGVTNGLRLARDQFPHDVTPTTTVSGEDTMSQAELDKILKNIQVSTGATASGANTGTGK